MGVVVESENFVAPDLQGRRGGEDAESRSVIAHGVDFDVVASQFVHIDVEASDAVFPFILLEDDDIESGFQRLRRVDGDVVGCLFDNFRGVSPAFVLLQNDGASFGESRAVNGDVGAGELSRGYFQICDGKERVGCLDGIVILRTSGK